MKVAGMVELKLGIGERLSRRRQAQEVAAKAGAESETQLNRPRT
jgi:hypothetical protein